MLGHYPHLESTLTLPHEDDKVSGHIYQASTTTRGALRIRSFMSSRHANSGIVPQQATVVNIASGSDPAESAARIWRNCAEHWSSMSASG
jgi:hypothetical protein